MLRIAMEEEIIKENITPPEDLHAKCEEYLNGWKRAKADLTNNQAAEGKRFTEFAKFALEAILKDLVIVQDSFALAIAATAETDAAYAGLQIIQSQLEETLKKYGLEKISVKEGDAFDPARHEAMALVDGNGTPPETIAQEIEKGYILNGKVIKPARVTITK